MSGITTFSLEVELGWGVVHYDQMDYLSENREKETEALRKLLTLCDTYEITFSFDIVGHLFLDAPLNSYDTPHDEGWFDPIPKTGVSTDPEFYAPDLVQMIRDAEMDHEICTHTFSHIEMGSVSKEVISWDLDKAKDVHESAGLPTPTSLVPPTHDPPPEGALRENGIQTVRVTQYQAPNSQFPPTRAHLLYDILSGKHPIVEPKTSDGVLVSYSTNHLSLGSSFLPRGQSDPKLPYRAIPLPIRKRLHRKNLNDALTSAINKSSYAHFWSHLFDISNSVQWPLVEEFLHNVGSSRSGGDIVVKTMDELEDAKRTKHI